MYQAVVGWGELCDPGNELPKGRELEKKCRGGRWDGDQNKITG